MVNVAQTGRVAVSKLMLWLNSGCNARCSMCDIWREGVGRSLSADQVRDWAPEWKAQGLRTVVLCGESLMHPQLWEIVAGIRELGIRVELLSNGLLLRNHAANVVQYCDVLRVSLDGPFEVHNQMRGIATAFTKLKDGIVALRMVSSDYPVTGRCAVHRQNFRFLPETVRAAKELGLSGINFSGTDVHNEEAFRRFGRIDGEYVETLSIGGAELDEFSTQLDRLSDECAEEFSSGFITDSPEFLKQQVLGYYLDLAGRGKRTIRCNSPWTSAVLEYDGTVRPCFPMPAFGNIVQLGGLGGTANSEAADRARAALTVQTNAICRRCVDQTVNSCLDGYV